MSEPAEAAKGAPALAMHLSPDQQRQRQKLQAVGELATGVAHSFNNTLQGILGNVELARMQAPDDIKPFLDNALSSCADASRLVKNLLQFAGHQARAEQEIASLEACAERVVSMCRVTFDRSLSLKIELKAPLPPVPIHPNEFEHALFCVLMNARDALAGQRRGEITVELGTVPVGAAELTKPSAHAWGGPFACVRVRDNGPGLPTTARGPAFEPFVNQLAREGRRMGLAHLLECARLHGGWASAESTLPHEASPAQPQGTVVSLFLPYGINKPATPTGAEPTSKLPGPVVLVVDDDDIVRDSVARVLRFGGFTAFTAPDGAAALAFIERGRPAPALVLMDESMPGMDGTTTRKQINRIAPDIRIVMISGHPGLPDDEDGVHGVLEKPVRADVLLDAIRSTLGLVRTPS